MKYIYSKVSLENNFFGNSNPVFLAENFGTPLYVYNENILRERCRELKKLIDYKHFVVNYSPKANSNVELIKIVREEGLRVDAMSPGEIFVNRLAGYKPKEILYISNNVIYYITLECSNFDRCPVVNLEFTLGYHFTLRWCLLHALP